MSDEGREAVPQAERPPEGASEEVASEHGEPNYMAVWAGLAVLTLAEVGVAFLEMLPKSAIVLMLVGLAIWKALLVALYYMHLRFEPNRLRLLVVSPLPLVAILVVAMLMEYV